MGLLIYSYYNNMHLINVIIFFWGGDGTVDFAINRLVDLNGPMPNGREKGNSLRIKWLF